MIIKSKSRSKRTWSQLLNYIEAGSDSRSIIVTHNLFGRSHEELVKEFRDNDRLRLHERADGVRLYHEILSWHDLDTAAITKEKLDDLTRQYINLRADRGLVFAMSHHDRDHVHVHLCISGVECATGKSIRMSKSQFTAVKRTLQNYQERTYPELTHSIAEHGRTARRVRSEREAQMERRTGQPSKRSTITKELFALWQQSHTLEGFERSLAQRSASLYRRNGRPQGVLIDGVKYRLSSIGINAEEVQKAVAAPSRLETLQRVRARAQSRDREPVKGRTIHREQHHERKQP